MVVGILALTTQLTSGSLSSSFGFFCPQPPLATVLSTGTDLGISWAAERCKGVEVPGVDGGVKAGDTRSGRGASGSASEFASANGR